MSFPPGIRGVLSLRPDRECRAYHNFNIWSRSPRPWTRGARHVRVERPLSPLCCFRAAVPVYAARPPPRQWDKALPCPDPSKARTASPCPVGKSTTHLCGRSRCSLSTPYWKYTCALLYSSSFLPYARPPPGLPLFMSTTPPNLGGSLDDQPAGIAVDTAGNAYI